MSDRLFPLVFSKIKTSTKPRDCFERKAIKSQPCPEFPPAYNAAAFHFHEIRWDQKCMDRITMNLPFA